MMLSIENTYSIDELRKYGQKIAGGAGLFVIAAGLCWSTGGIFVRNVKDHPQWFRQRPDAWAEQFARCVNLDDPADRGFGHLECVLTP